MASQTIVWTVLPKGIQDGKLRVSVFMSPRLTPAGAIGTLGEFPNFWGPTSGHWPGTVIQRGFQLEFRIGGSPVTVGTNPNGSKPDPKLWEALFKSTTPVKPFQYRDFSTRFIHTFPVRTVVGYLKDLYTGVAQTAPTTFPRLRPVKDDSPIPTLQGLIGVVGKVAGDERWQRKPWDPARFVKDQKNHVLNPDSFQQYGFASKEEMAFAQVNRFYNRPRSANPYRETPDPLLVGVRPRLAVPKPDFHEMLASLGDYGLLMRMLGVVVDLEVAIPPGETIGKYIAADAVRVRALNTHEYTPWTRITKSFVAEARAGGDITEGMLRLDSKDLYELLQVDADALGLKALQFAGAMASINETQGGAAPRVNYTMANTQALPSIRTSGLAVARNNRAARIADQLANSSALNAKLVGNVAAELYADDLVRGYRVDVLDKTTGDWHSLCERIGRFTFTGGAYPEQNLRDEGYVKGTSTTSTDDGLPTDQELYLHETVFQWDGWSLAASRPGRTIVAETYGPDNKPLVEQKEVVKKQENKAVTDLPLSVEMRAQPGSLPRLRFGREYALRARVVDIAGNSLPLKAPGSWDTAEPSWVALSAGDHATQSLIYGRFEPVATPALVPRTAFGEGEAAERMVIRSNGGVDPAAYAAQAYVVAALTGKWYSYNPVSERHFAPPKTSQLNAEVHGRFEDWIGKGTEHKAGFNVAVKEAGTFMDAKIVDVASGDATIDSPSTKLVTPPTALGPNAMPAGMTPPTDPAAVKPGDRLAAGQYVIHDVDNLPLPYLPDPIARGVSLRGLPKIISPGTIPGGLPAVKLGPGFDAVALKVPFDGKWPDALPFRLQLAEGSGQPKWDGDARLLIVSLPKGRIARVLYSCYLGSDPASGRPDIELMGLSRWVSDPGSQLRPFAETGSHWMLTPFRMLELVHAVQQPLKLPTFDKAEIRKWNLGDTFVNIYGFIAIDAPSTGKLEVFAEWFDPVDLLTADTPQDQPGVDGAPEFNHRGSVFTLNIDEDAPDHLVIHCPDIDGITYVRQRDYLDFKGVDLPAVQTGESSKLASDIKASLSTPVEMKVPAKIEAGGISATEVGKGLTLTAKPADGTLVDPAHAPYCRHEFNDTKHRFVNYRTVATTRYREYFAEAIIRDPKNISVDGPIWERANVLSSARPDAPKVLYSVPTFGWETEKIAGQLISRRCGNALRVYLDRPWYSSGEGELLGVVLRQPGSPTLTTAEALSSDPMKPFTSIAGMDPIWGSEYTKSELKISDFPLATHGQAGLTIDEVTGATVAVAGHPVDYDKERKLWYCDIEIDAGPSYYPFVRLALARYQPDSLPDAHLSRVVLTDYAQLASERVAAVIFDPSDELKVDVLVSGIYGVSRLFDVPPGSPDPAQYRFGPLDGKEDLAVQAGSRVFLAAIETKPPGSGLDVPWVPLTGVDKQIITLEPGMKVGEKMIWGGAFKLAEAPRKPGGRLYRIVISESEVLAIDGPTFATGAVTVLSRGSRLVYADTIELQ